MSMRKNPSIQPRRRRESDASAAAGHPLAAFRRLALRLTAEWQHRLPNFAASDANQVHQLRLLLRRARTLLRIFSPALSRNMHKRWATEFRATAHAFDAARDLDVLIDSVLPSLVKDCEPKPSNASLRALKRSLTRSARHAHHNAGKQFTAGTINHLITRFTTDLHRTRGARATADMTAKKFLAQRVRTLDARARRKLKRCRIDDCASLHELRIALKQTRDTRIELAELLARKYRKRLQELRDATAALGELQDLERARVLLSQSMTTERARAALITSLVSQSERRHRKLAPIARRRAERALER